MSLKHTIPPSSMNFSAVLLTLFLIVRVKFTKCQRLTHTEMKTVLNQNKHSTPKIPPTAENLRCLLAINGSYHPQVPYVFAVCETYNFYLEVLHFSYNTVLKANYCNNIDCWESQLTDATKLDIVDIFNSYRQSVARGSCGWRCKINKRRLIFEVRWLYYFELDAWQIIRFCKPTVNETNISTNYKKENPVSYGLGDFVATSFKVETGLQSELRAKLWDILNGNYFYDWEAKTQQFRRGLTNEVGCVYLVRRNISMKTAFGENVVSGDVGHFGCFFGYINKEAMNDWSYRNLSTTAENCRGAGGDKKSTVTPDALYPSLCKEIQDLAYFDSPAVTCQPNYAYNNKLFNETCKGSGSIQNKKTWSEKVSGLLLRYAYNGTIHDFYNAECNLPEPSKQNAFNNTASNKTSPPCTNKHEVNVTTTTELCPGWSYSDSQLTVETRQRILDSLNEARHLVALGKCNKDLCHSPCNCNKKLEYCNVVKLQWHWYLESLAAKKVQNCPSQYATNKSNYPNSPFSESSFFEEVSIVFDLPPEKQTKLPDQIVKLFWTNGLNDWENDGTFRRGSAAWIGCAIIVQPGQQIGSMREEYRTKNGAATHMVCVYVSMDEDFISKQDSVTKHCCPGCTQGSLFTGSNTCLLKTAKGVSPFPFLCSSILYSEEITLNCAVNTRSELIKRPTNKLKQIYSRKVCKIVIFLYLVALSVLLLVLALLYKYSVEKK